MRKRIYRCGLRQIIFAPPRDIITGVELPADTELFEDREENEKALEGIRSGRLALIVLEPAPRLMTPMEAPRLTPEELDESPERSWIEVTLVAPSGRLYVGTTFELTMPDGSSQQATTDGAGNWRLEDLEPGGTCRLRLTDKPGAPDRARSSVPLQGDEPRVRFGKGDVPLRLGRQHQVVVVRPPALFSF